MNECRTFALIKSCSMNHLVSHRDIRRSVVGIIHSNKAWRRWGISLVLQMAIMPIALASSAINPNPLSSLLTNHQHGFSVEESLPSNDGLDVEVLGQKDLSWQADTVDSAQPLSPVTQSVPLNAISPKTLAMFVDLINTIRTQYLYAVNDENLFVQAMKGMLKGLDPYSELLDRQQYDDLQTITQGGLGQVGIDVAYHDDLAHWVVEAVLPESPAEQQGINVGDYLHAIDGVKLTKMLNHEDVKAKLIGLIGSYVELSVSMAGRQKRQVGLARSINTDASVSVSWQDGVAIIRIPVFQEVSRQQILQELLRYPEPVRGVIFDVRNNPGGVLESAVAIVSLFQNNHKPIAYLENRQGIKEVFYPKGRAILAGLPVVVLQNRHSASASEVMASGLKNNPTALIMGETSYGKGSVQSVFELDQDYAIKLTVAHYLDANQQNIHGQGVMPDVALLPLPIQAMSTKAMPTQADDNKFIPKPFNLLDRLDGADDPWLQQALLWVTGQSLNAELLDAKQPQNRKTWLTHFPHGIRLSGQINNMP